MTTDRILPDEQEIEVIIEPSYAFMPQTIEAMGRSIPLVVGARLCDAAVAKVDSANGWQGMTYKELRKLFKDNCSNQEGYLCPQSPVLETVVRMLLVSKKDSLTLTEIHSEISALWITSPWPRHITIESLQRVLDKATGYGISRIV